jgi:3',5'-cyclic AMP phosphodiesterase CpdA
MAFGGAGTLFMLSGGAFRAIDLAQAAQGDNSSLAAGTPLFVQISDTHIGFNKAANPDVVGTFGHAIALINALPIAPRCIVHTGDITHLSRAEEFDTAQQMLTTLRAGEIYTVPGEHDVTDGVGVEYFRRFGGSSKQKGYYSFDLDGVHFVGLVNVMNFKPGGLGLLGSDQLAWLKDDFASRTASTPIVVFAHMPLWSIYEPWGWGTGDAGEAMALLRRFGSVTVLNGHIHQIVQKIEGNITFHTARSTAYPQPAAGVGPGPGPLTVSAADLPTRLGVTTITHSEHSLSLSDTTLAQPV